MSNLSRLLITIVIFACALAGLWWYLHAPRESGSAGPTVPWSDVSRPANSGETAYHNSERLGVITDPRLNEISGIAASRRTPDVWWVHNDSDDLPRIFAVHSSGKLIAEFRVPGAVNEDWEDIATGPGPDSSPALYIADIGDNFLRRDFVVIYRVKEPDVSDPGDPAETGNIEPFQLKYPDGRHNAEALVVDPVSGRLYVITKTDSKACQVFRSPLPLKLGEAMTFEEVTGDASAVIGQWRKVTGATTAPDGSRIAIRTYFSAFELVRPPGKDFESAFSAKPDPLSLPLEQQGEAISYSGDGKALVTTSEKIPAPIHIMKRK